MGSKMLILGEGYIGSRLQEAFGCAVSDSRIYSYQDAESEIRRFNPEIIINCIGHTGINVDGCEVDKDKTLIANSFVPLMLAEICLRHKIRLVHISSGCIYHYDYSRDTPIDEKKVPDYFELFYSRTKIYSEGALGVLSMKFPILIARTRIPLDNRPHPKNLLTKLINYKRVIDIPNSVIYIPDLIKALQHLIKIEATGIYNVVNKGPLRYQQLLEVYKKYVPDFEYETIDFKKLNLARTNLILSTKKLEGSGFKIREVKDVLEECVREYLKYS